jgi:hypothetical protein
MKIDLNSLANDMDAVLNSEQNKNMFSSAKMLEKLAFKRVSDETPTELENQVSNSLGKTAEKEECKCACHDKCKCSCGDKKSTAGLNVVANTQDEYMLAINAAETMLSISETLDGVGFEKLATVSLMLADKIVVEAKAKAKKKSKPADKKSDKAKSSEKDSKKDDKKSSKDSKKSTDKKSDKKDSKKSSDKKSK